MGRKKRGKPETEAIPRLGLRWWWLVAFVLLASAAFAFLRLASREPPQVPDADRSLMEPQVAQKIQAHREAVLASPDSSQAWGELGVVFQAHGLSEQAARCHRKAIELDSREFRWQYLLVHALRDFDRAAALAESARAIEIRDDYAPIYVVRAELLERENALEEAKTLYGKTLTLDSDNAAALAGLGRLAMGNGDLETARGYLERARDASPKAGSVHALLAQLYRRLGEADKAVEEAGLAFRNTEPVTITDSLHFRMTQESVASTARLERAISAEEAGDYGAAEGIYRELVVLRPEDADIRSRLGDVLARRNEKEEAETHYRAALASNPDHAGALYGLGTVLGFQGRYGEAVGFYRRALEVRPEHAATLSNLASLVAHQGNEEEALLLYRKALELEPEHVPSHRGLAELYFREKKHSDAVPHFRKVLESKPELGPVHLQLGASLAMIGEYREAWSHLVRARELGEKVPDELYGEVERRVSAGEK